MRIHSGESRPRGAQGTHAPSPGVTPAPLVPVGRAYSELEQYEFSSEHLQAHVCCLESMKLGRPSQYQLKKNLWSLGQLLTTKLHSCFTVERTGSVWSLPPGELFDLDQGHGWPTATWESSLLSVVALLHQHHCGTQRISRGLGRQVRWLTFL